MVPEIERRHVGMLDNCLAAKIYSKRLCGIGIKLDRPDDCGPCLGGPYIKPASPGK